MVEGLGARSVDAAAVVCLLPRVPLRTDHDHRSLSTHVTRHTMGFATLLAACCYGARHVDCEYI